MTWEKQLGWHDNKVCSELTWLSIKYHFIDHLEEIFVGRTWNWTINFPALRQLLYKPQLSHTVASITLHSNFLVQEDIPHENTDNAKVKQIIFTENMEHRKRAPEIEAIISRTSEEKKAPSPTDWHSLWWKQLKLFVAHKQCHGGCGTHDASLYRDKN